MNNRTNQTKPQIKNLISALILSLALLAAACGGGSGRGKTVGPQEGKSFPSPGTPSGSDAISSSTNHSDKKKETAPKLDPFAGASYIKPPAINNYGTVSLGYAIDVPAGRSGMQPSVGLSYSSSGGDGLAGIGWSLGTGLGVISRTTSHGQVYYDYRDTFTFNGKRLVKVEGSRTEQNGIYRLEIESGFSKFELRDAETGGVWYVYDKAGAVTIFGSSPETRIYHPDDNSKTYIWNFSSSTDLNGNFMRAEYDTSDYEEKRILYLKEIRYTGNIYESHEPRQWVRFHYKKRTDAYVSKAPGFIMAMDRLLDRVEVGWDSGGFLSDETTLWDYTLVYNISTDSNRPILETIESSREVTKPKFYYQDAVHNFVWQKVNNPHASDPEVNPYKTRYFEGDFNGDGISDMVFFNPETGYWKAAQGQAGGGYTFPVYANHFKGYDSDEKIQFFKGNVSGDYNGDGRSDIAMYLPETREFWVAEHNGQSFSFRMYGRLSADIDIMKCEWFAGDYDGNGLSDSVLYNEPTGDWWLMRNVGRSFEFVKFSHKFQNLFRADYSPNSNMDSASTSDNSAQGGARDKVHFLNGDYNGDGRTDISVYDKRSGHWWVAENYRDDYGSVPFKLEWKLYKVFTAPEQALFAHDRFSGDFNGDGFSDFLLFDRQSGEWILGAVEDRNINFTVWSRAPQFKDITRWLQGDFNGDGRTDIGFYSKTDQNFWIGEATPDGFRYRVYNNLNYGPDPEKVLEKAPLPRDEVKVTDGSAITANSLGVSKVTYQYDSNASTTRGELVFTGNFSGADAKPEMLVYDKAAQKFYEYDVSTSARTEAAIDAIDITGDGSDTQSYKPVHGKAERYADERDGLFLYRKTSNGHEFSVVHNNGSWKHETLGTFGNDEINNFDITKHLTLNGLFGDDTTQSVLVLDPNTDQYNTNAVFYKLSGSSSALTIELDSTDTAEKEQFAEIFNQYEQNKQYLCFFTGTFTGENQLLMIDTRNTSQHVWYVGSISGSAITFEKLSGSAQFVSEGYTKSYRSIENGTSHELFYVTGSNGRTQFHKVTFDSAAKSVSTQSYPQIPSLYTFKGEYDDKDRPIVYYNTKIYSTVLGTGSLTYETLVPTGYTPKREDLYQKIYPFRWIQGDYNGDGKTDIGIFHLKEGTWYFAVTEGTVPDMIERVDNGIGGHYTFEYANSSQFDNTGDDEIPDLPMNYKVCTKLTVSDGRSHAHGSWGEYSTYYEYEGGKAFSAFINGYKETDFFGFTKFTVVDAVGNKSISEYYSQPYEDDFRKNRALAGAVKKSQYLGSDRKEYASTEYVYTVHEIIPQGAPLTPNGYTAKSFLIEPTEKREYFNQTLIKTTKSNITLTPNEYEMVSQSESVTDHYDDAIHDPVTVTSYSEFENIESTNEMRLTRKVSMQGTDYQVTTTNVEFDERGNLKHTETEYTGSGLASASKKVLRYWYDGYGQLTTTYDESGTPTRAKRNYYDDELHQFVKGIRTYGDVVYSYYEEFYINYDIAFGGIDRKRDTNLNSTYFEYDKYGRLVDEYTDVNGSKTHLQNYEYTSDFPMSVKLTKYAGDGQAPVESRVFADGLGRVVHSVSSATTVPGKLYVKSGRVVYDQAGRVIRQSQTHWAKDSEIDEYMPNYSDKHPTYTEYDASGRVRKVTMPKAENETEETSIFYTYNDPWETVQRHSIGRSSRTVKNARGLVLYSETWGTGDDGVEVRTQVGFGYDAAGRRIAKFDMNAGTTTPLNPPIRGDVPDPGTASVRNADDNNVYWWYDGFGRVVATNDPDFGASWVTYNAFGDVETSTDALGRTTTMLYDRLGRVTEKIQPGTEGSVVYEYDILDYSDNALGRLVAIDDVNQRKEFSYDELGRIVSEKRVMKDVGQWSSGGTFETHFKYDLLARHREITYPEDPVSGNRAVVTYGYSPMGVNTVHVESGSVSKDLITGIVYNEFGQMDTVSRGNSTTTDYVYDIKGRLMNLVTTDSNGRKIQDVSYDFKIDNSIAGVENRPEVTPDGFDNSVVSYTYKYDGLNRLVHAGGTYERATSGIDRQFERGYSYAGNGNLMSKTMYDPESHAVQDNWIYTYTNHRVDRVTSTGIDGTKFDMFYDKVGNMTEQRDREKGFAKRMDFDSSNRITEVMDPDTGDLVGKYYYDDQGFRVRKVARRFMDNMWKHVEVVYPSMYFGMERQWTVEGQAIPETEFGINNIYLNGVRFAALTPQGEAQYYLTDQVDSVKVVVDDTGIPVSSFEYLPYGETWFQHGDTQHNAKYNSQELDTETGYYFYNARHYDPVIARFVTADSVVDGELSPMGWNRYMYVHGNPIRYMDPTGHQQQAAEEITEEVVKKAGKQFIPKVIEGGKNKVVQEVAKKSLLSKAVSWCARGLNVAAAVVAIVVTPTDTANVDVQAEEKLQNEIKILVNQLKDQLENPDEDNKKKQTLIYRLGNHTLRNCTPRIKDKDGNEKDVTNISFQMTKPTSGNYIVTSIEIVNKTRLLKAKQDKPNHAAVNAANAALYQDWRMSRKEIDESGDANYKGAHWFSHLLKSITIPIKQPKIKKNKKK